MKRSEDSKVIYPKEFSGYILWTIFWSLASVILLISVHKSGNLKLRVDLQTIVAVSFLVIPCIFSINLILTSIFLINKKIYVSYSKNEIQFNGLYRHKKLKINELNSITKDSYKNILGYIVFKKEATWTNISFKNIMFPMAWFSEKDVLRMVELIKTYNSHVVIKGLYASVYVYRKNKKKD